MNRVRPEGAALNLLCRACKNQDRADGAGSVHLCQGQPGCPQPLGFLFRVLCSASRVVGDLESERSEISSGSPLLMFDLRGSLLLFFRASHRTDQDPFVFGCS
jgi:hypothetical protein